MESALIAKFQKQYNNTIDFILEKRYPILSEKQQYNLSILERKCRELEIELDGILDGSIESSSSKYYMRYEELMETQREYENLKIKYEKEKVFETMEKLNSLAEQMRDTLNLEERIILINELLNITIDIQNEYINNRKKLPVIFENNNERFIDFSKLNPSDLQISVILYSLQIRNLDIDYCVDELFKIIKTNNNLYLATLFVGNVKTIIEGKINNNSDKQRFIK